MSTFFSGLFHNSAKIGVLLVTVLLVFYILVVAQRGWLLMTVGRSDQPRPWERPTSCCPPSGSGRWSVNCSSASRPRRWPGSSPMRADCPLMTCRARRPAGSSGKRPTPSSPSTRPKSRLNRSSGGPGSGFPVPTTPPGTASGHVRLDAPGRQALQRLSSGQLEPSSATLVMQQSGSTG